MNENVLQTSELLPFHNYPDCGRKLLGRVAGDSCRHGYGLTFIRLTGQTKCAYCGLDLAASYVNWLTLALDHVLPHSTCLAWNLPEDWREDFSNRVLCCTTCNTFGNRYKPTGYQCPTTLVEFYNVRDAIFVERKRKILLRQEEERAFFDKQPWK